MGHSGNIFCIGPGSKLIYQYVATYRLRRDVTHVLVRAKRQASEGSRTKCPPPVGEGGSQEVPSKVEKYAFLLNTFSKPT